MSVHVQSLTSSLKLETILNAQPLHFQVKSLRRRESVEQFDVDQAAAQKVYREDSGGGGSGRTSPEHHPHNNELTVAGAEMYSTFLSYPTATIQFCFERYFFLFFMYSMLTILLVGLTE